MNNHTRAVKIYNLCRDLDYMDYVDFEESDIATIEATIDRIGYRATKKMYLEIVNG